MRVIKKLLCGLAELPDGESVDVDDGWAGWAACELVALALGRAASEPSPSQMLALAARIAQTGAPQSRGAHAAAHSPRGRPPRWPASGTREPMVCASNLTATAERQLHLPIVGLCN